MDFSESFPRFSCARIRGLTFATQVQFQTYEQSAKYSDRSRALLSIQDTIQALLGYDQN